MRNNDNPPDAHSGDVPALLEDTSRAHIARFLPQAIGKALESYHSFMGQDVPDDAKGFSAHHTAAKVAIAHIDLLLKLARWADVAQRETIRSSAQEAMLAAMIRDGETVLAQYQARQELWEQEGEEDE